MKTGLVKWLALAAWAVLFVAVHLVEAAAFICSIPAMGLRFANKPAFRLLDYLSR